MPCVSTIFLGSDAQDRQDLISASMSTGRAGFGDVRAIRVSSGPGGPGDGLACCESVLPHARAVRLGQERVKPAILSAVVHDLRVQGLA
jgi:hypothetical protein